MRVLFIGSVKFSKSMLSLLIREKAEIVGVVTSIDNGLNSDFSDLLPLCKKENIPYHLTKDINSSLSIKWIRDLEPDLITCFGWSRLLKEKVLNIPKLGVLGFHPTELPKNRGRHPIIWSIALGLKKTASTFFFMSKGADDGGILSQKIIEISKNDDASSLYKKVTKSAEKQLSTLIKQLKKGTHTVSLQDDFKANYWRKRTVDDGEIDWRMSANNIHNLVKALSKPYPGAHFFHNNKKYTVWKTRVNKTKGSKNSEPGKIIKIHKDNTVVVKCSEYSIDLLEYEPFIKIKTGDYL